MVVVVVGGMVRPPSQTLLACTESQCNFTGSLVLFNLASSLTAIAFLKLVDRQHLLLPVWRSLLHRLPHNDSPNWWAGTVTRWWSGGLKGSRAGSWCPHGGPSPPAHCCQYSCMDASSLNLKKSKAGDKVCFLWPLNLFWTFCKTQEVIFLLSDIPYFFKSDLYFYWTQLSLGSDLWVRMSVTDWLTDWATLLRLNWCDSGWWRYQLNTNW